MSTKFFVSMLFLLATLLTASCGGQMLAPAADAPELIGGPIPNVFNEFNGVPSRGASDVTTIPGSDALMNVGGLVDGSSMVIDSSGTSGNMAWALYKVSGLAGRRATTLGVELTLPQLSSRYSVGVANFSEGVWDFLQTFEGLPEFNYNLSEEEARLVSQLGNLYFVVVVSSGHSATILQASVLSEEETPDNQTLPLRAQRPSVSEGLADRIEVSWAAVAGADGYELWRRTDGAVDGPWELLASQAELTYTDMAVELSVEYAYKVRGFNGVGAGGFSEKRSGWAGAAPAGHDEEDDEDIEVEGQIEAIGESSLTIAGIEFTVNGNTMFFDDNDLPLTFADFAVGMFAEVEADDNGAGAWIARKVEMEDGTGGGGGGGDDQRFEGLLQAIDATGLQINGVTVLHDSGTEFRDINEQSVTWEHFAAGDEVKVRAIENGNGELVAYRVEMEDEGPGDDNGQQVFLGTIDSISEAEIVVSGQPINLTAATTYSDNAGNPVDYAFFSAGMQVEVDADGNDIDGWTAIHVQEEVENN